MAYEIREITCRDKEALLQVRSLLASEGLTVDAHLDYTCGLFDEQDTLIATGSCFASTLRCFAVARDHQGEGLLNEVVTHLMDVQAARGNFHLFVYTKPRSARFFESLGFSEITHLDGTLVFLENRKHGFSDYCKSLGATDSGDAAAIVVNANPFTLGHRYLVEQAAGQYGTVHLFVLSEDRSFFPAAVRYRLVREGTADIPGVVLHETQDYLISAATFPGYFLKGSEAAAQAGARLDAAVFARIAEHLGIQARFVGDEPSSAVTRLYNEVLATELPKAGVSCVIVPRLEKDGQIVSASTVRQLIHDSRLDDVCALVPPSTWNYIISPDAADVIRAIRDADEVRHF